MKYKGIEIKDFTNGAPILFDPPKKMLCWDLGVELLDSEDIHTVYAYIPCNIYPVKTSNGCFIKCAEIPEITEEPKTRRATNLELSKWLAHANGVCKYSRDSMRSFTSLSYIDAEADNECKSSWLVRKWDDKEWHEPTADYMGLEG